MGSRGDRTDVPAAAVYLMRAAFARTFRTGGPVCPPPVMF